MVSNPQANGDRAVKASLAPLFEPRSVAVVGASRDPSKVGGSVLANLQAGGFAGRVVPVNAAADTVQGLAAAPSLLAVEGPIDLAVVAVPAPAVLAALRDCAAKGVGAAVVLSAGFRESGTEGRQREAGDADAARYGNALRAVGPVADATLVLLTAQAATDSVGVARAVLGAVRDWPSPVAAAFVGGGRVTPGARALEEGGIPCYPFPEPAVATLARMALLAERRRRPPASAVTPAASRAASELLATVRGAEAAGLGWPELAPLLAAYGIPIAAAQVVTTPDEAAAVATRLERPVALKVVSPDLSHKTDAGAVRLGLHGATAVREAAVAMLARVRRERPAARIRGLLVQSMVGAGHELLLGMKTREKEEKDETYFYMERGYGAFARTIRLPVPVDPSKVTATFKNGLLTVKLPKGTAAKGTTIPIKAE